MKSITLIFLMLASVGFAGAPQGAIAGDWSVSFIWRPNFSAVEVMGTVPIATIHTTGEYCSIYWTSTVISGMADGGAFYATDGTSTITIEDDYGWGYDESVKVAVTHSDGGNTVLYIETIKNGTLSGSNSLALNTPLNYTQFAANPNGSVTGRGFYGETQYWESDLSSTAIQKVFDFDPNAPAPVVHLTAEDYIFHRNSIRFDEEINQYAENEPIVESVAVAERVVPTVGTLSYPPLWTDGTKCYYVRSSGLYSTTDGVNYTPEALLSSIPAFDTAVAAGYQAHYGYKTKDGGILLALRLHDGGGPSWLYGKLFKKNPTTGDWSEVLNTTAGFFPSYQWYGVSDAEIIIGTYNKHTPNLNANEVWYSGDYGATFSKIFTFDDATFKALYPNRILSEFSYDTFHLHMTAWFPGTTDKALVFSGDRRFSNQYTLQYDGTGSKYDPAHWSIVDQMNYRVQPTACVAYNEKFYIGADGPLGIHGMVGEIEASPPYRSRTVCTALQPQSLMTADVPLERTSYLWCFALQQIDGVFYAGGYEPHAKNSSKTCGVYVSPDATHWCRSMAVGGRGVRDITVNADALDRIWARRVGSDSDPGAMIYWTPPNIKTVQMVSVEKGVENLLTANGSHEFSTGLTMYDLTAASGQSSEASLYGTYSCYLEGEYQGGSNPLLVWQPLGVNNYWNDASNDYYCFITHYKLLDHLRNTDPTVDIPEIVDYANQDSLYVDPGEDAPMILTNGWSRSTIWMRNKETFSPTDRFYITLKGNGLPEADWGKMRAYLDCAALYKSDDLYHSGAWQPGGRPRADEILIAPAFKSQGPSPKTEACVDAPSMDSNGDCIVDLIDFSVFASEWLFVSSNTEDCIDFPLMDSNGDCTVDLIDLNEFVSQWLMYSSSKTCVEQPSMDSNGDCKVDFIDFCEFALQWMSCGLEDPSNCWE